MVVNIDISPIQEGIVNFSKTLSLTPITKTVSNLSGNETLTEGTSVEVSGALFRKEDTWSQDKAGLFQGADAILLTLPDDPIAKNTIITYNGENYRTQKTVMRKIAETDVYYATQLWKK